VEKSYAERAPAANLKRSVLEMEGNLCLGESRAGKM